MTFKYTSSNSMQSTTMQDSRSMTISTACTAKHAQHSMTFEHTSPDSTDSTPRQESRSTIIANTQHAQHSMTFESTSPESMDSTTRQEPRSMTMSHMALPFCSTITSPGTRLCDDTALTHPPFTMGVRRRWFTREVILTFCCLTTSSREIAAAAVAAASRAGSQK